MKGKRNVTKWRPQWKRRGETVRWSRSRLDRRWRSFFSLSHLAHRSVAGVAIAARLSDQHGIPHALPLPQWHGCCPQLGSAHYGKSSIQILLPFFFILLLSRRILKWFLKARNLKRRGSREGGPFWLFLFFQPPNFFLFFLFFFTSVAGQISTGGVAESSGRSLFSNSVSWLVCERNLMSCHTKKERISFDVRFRDIGVVVEKVWKGEKDQRRRARSKEKKKVFFSGAEITPKDWSRVEARWGKGGGEENDFFVVIKKRRTSCRFLLRVTLRAPLVFLVFFFSFWSSSSHWRILSCRTPCWVP